IARAINQDRNKHDDQRDNVCFAFSVVGKLFNSQSLPPTLVGGRLLLYGSNRTSDFAASKDRQA
ncbi:MAG: hypothetical protein QOE73_248, partial [Verrucomicrobiota bacterium]